jgi:hypothetical protein
MRPEKPLSDVASLIAGIANGREGWVFICYPRRTEPIAIELASILRSRGCSVWIDIERLEISREVKTQLISAIEMSSAFVLLVDDSSAESTWVSFEVEVARETLAPTRMVDVHVFS